MSVARAEALSTTSRATPESSHAEHFVTTTDWLRIASVGASALVIALLRPQLSVQTAITAIALAVGGFPMFEEAWENVVQRRMTMELSMALAIVAAAIIREFVTALLITLFVLVAEILEHMTVDRGRRAIGDVLGYLPNEVEIKVGGVIEKHPVSELMPNDIILVRPGGRIPVDGLVVAGASAVDESTITGEVLPAEKQEGSTVLAGTFNQSGALEVQVVAVGKDTSFAKIIEAVEQAEQTKAPIQKTADRLAGYLVYFALSAAALTFLITRQIRPTISVVIVAGACGVAAGTPLAILGAIGRCARQGVIFKGGVYLEALWDIGTVIFDKTGTVTFGSIEIVDIVCAPGVAANEIVAAAATAEHNSEHPVGKAVVAYARARQIAAETPDQFHYQPGKGVLAQTASRVIVAGNRSWLEEKGIKSIGAGAKTDGTHIFVAENGRFLGALVLADRMRGEAKQAIGALHSLGLKTVLLSGDSDQVAQNVANALKIQSAEGSLLPHEKSDYVHRIVSEGQKVLMVGDGVNDAPALAQATVSIAMGSGTDVARETANGLLIGNDLCRLVAALKTSRLCRRIIMQNFYGTILVDLAGIALAACAVINPLTAAFIHVSSEMLFILNSTRLLHHRR